ncbi:MAG: hypothetical protein EBZ43_01260, partial [Betaproteobacteria bacterium]|nr:hypothetical protein [Betaproteobacteria bacterium]
MPTKIYVGNLPWRATDEQLTTMFSAHGEVTEARIVTDRETGRSRGFAFVTMTDATTAGCHGAFKFYDFPQGLIYIQGYNVNLTTLAGL